MKNTVQTFLNAKNKSKISMLTAYDYITATLLDKVGINGILVGDSLGMVIQGHENTLAVTMEHMIYHTQAVCRGTKNALVVTDMPFMSYQTSIEQAVNNAGKLMKESGCQAVKLEGGKNIANTVSKIVACGIPVMGHIGMTPQSVHAYGGFLVQGKSYEKAKRIVDDAIALEKAGAFSIVLECIPAELATFITNLLSVPTIGIGAGNSCDGQVLVFQDMLGISTNYGADEKSNVPKFVKQYENLNYSIIEAFQNYIKEVETGDFPNSNHTFKIDNYVIDNLKKEFE